MLVRRLELEGGLEEGCTRYFWNVRIGLHIDPCIFTVQLWSPSFWPPRYNFRCALSSP